MWGEKRASRRAWRAEQRAEKLARKEAWLAERRRGSGVGGCLGAIVFIIFAALVFGMFTSGSVDPAAKQLALRAISKIGLEAGWDHVEVTDAKPNEYELKLVYREPPSDFAVRQDTRKLALAVLSELVATGRHPSNDGTFLWVWAQRPAGRGETGTDLVQVYGHMEYKADNDQLEFKPWKP